MQNVWRCPSCRSRAGVPVRYGLPDQSALEAARRGELVLGGAVLGDDDPPRCCTACRAALWAGGVFAVPGAGGDLRVVLARRFGGRRLEASVSVDLDFTLGWSGTGVPEHDVVFTGASVDLLTAFVAAPFLADGSRLARWLERNRIGFVGSIDGRIDRFSITPDAMVSFEGPGGALMVHTSVERFLLCGVAALFRHHGFRTIGEVREWMTAQAAAFLRSLP